MSTAQSPTKLKSMIAMLASEHDGECLAAARALVRVAKSSGQKVEELISVAEQRAPTVAQPPPRRQKREFRSDRLWKEWPEVLSLIATRTAGTTILARNESIFIQIMSERAGDDDFEPEDWRLRFLWKIATRVGVV